MKKVITRKDIALAVSKRMSISQKDAEMVLGAVIDVMRENLEQANEIALRRFGAFRLKSWKARISQDPRDPSVKVEVPAHNRVRFIPAADVFSKLVKTPLVDPVDPSV